MKARILGSELRSLSSDFVLRPTTFRGDAVEAATRAVEQGFDIVVAAGGDGTVNEVLNGIAAHPLGLLRTRLALIPLGTMNVFARELGIPTSVDSAIRLIKEASETLLDIGRIQYPQRYPPKVRYFAQLAGAGLDATAVELVSWTLKKKLGAAAYLLATIRALRRKCSLVVETSGMQMQAELVLIGNGKLYGGPLAVFPFADLRDGKLDVCVFRKVNVTHLLAFCWGALRGKFLESSNIQRFSTAHLKLTPAGPNLVPLQLDGESAGKLPAEISVLPRGLRVIIGARQVLI